MQPNATEWNYVEACERSKCCQVCLCAGSHPSDRAEWWSRMMKRGDGVKWLKWCCWANIVRNSQLYQVISLASDNCSMPSRHFGWLGFLILLSEHIEFIKRRPVIQIWKVSRRNWGGWVHKFWFRYSFSLELTCPDSSIGVHTLNWILWTSKYSFIAVLVAT